MRKLKSKSPTRSHSNGLKKYLESEKNQIEYLRANIEENSDMPEAIILALKDIAEVRGYEKLAKEAGLSKKSLYKILSEDSKPRYETIVQIIHGLGLRFTLEPATQKVGA
jgi:probable addiction module antidote protein